MMAPRAPVGTRSIAVSNRSPVARGMATSRVPYTGVQPNRTREFLPAENRKYLQCTITHWKYHSISKLASHQ